MDSRHEIASFARSRMFGCLVAGLLVGTAISPISLAAQTFTVRLLNGRTGNPMPNKMVTASWADGLRSTVISIGKDGLGHLDVAPGTTEFVLSVGPKSGDEPYRLAFINCNDRVMAKIQVSKVAETGVVPVNLCGSHTAVPKPNEIVFWARPKPWWLPDFQ